MAKNKIKRNIKRTGSAFFGIAFAMIILALAVFAGVYMEKNTTIQSLNVEGSYFHDPEDILESIYSPVGMRADSVNFDSIFAQIKALPFVEDVSVSMSMRGVLTFQISEHKPIALLINGSSRSYIARGGVVLPVLTGKIVDVPLIYGVNMTGESFSGKSKEVQLMNEFLSALQENETGWATISEVTWNNREGIIALTTENGVKLIFGEEDYSQKLKDWQVFYAEIVIRKGLQSFDIIDLRFRDQIVTRKL